MGILQMYGNCATAEWRGKQIRIFAKLNCRDESACRVRMSSARGAMAFAYLRGMFIFSLATNGSAHDGGVVENSPDCLKITGFRSALPGRPESETLEATGRDFLLRFESVTTRTNVEYGTPSLIVAEKDIYPGSAPARVA